MNFIRASLVVTIVLAAPAIGQDRTIPMGNPLGDRAIVMPGATVSTPSPLEAAMEAQRRQARQAAARAQQAQALADAGPRPPAAVADDPGREPVRADQAAGEDDRGRSGASVYGTITTPWGNGGIRPAWAR